MKGVSRQQHEEGMNHLPGGLIGTGCYMTTEALNRSVANHVPSCSAIYCYTHWMMVIEHVDIWGFASLNAVGSGAGLRLFISQITSWICWIYATLGFWHIFQNFCNLLSFWLSPCICDLGLAGSYTRSKSGCC
jgi:hypothetical protein